MLHWRYFFYHVVVVHVGKQYVVLFQLYVVDKDALFSFLA